MEEKRKLSIVVPIYNSKRITRLLNSFGSNSLDQIEIIIIDDGSSDDSVSVCNEYAKKHSNYAIKIFSKENGGVSSARNLGIEKANCEHLIFCDSDDELVSGAIDCLLTQITEDLDWFVYGLIRTEEQKNKALREYQGIYSKMDMINHLDTWLTDTEVLNSPVTKVYNRNILIEHQVRFDEEITIGEDLNFNLQYLENITKSIKVTNEPLYIYHTENSGSTSKFYKNYAEERWNTIRFVDEFFKKYNLERNLIYYLYIKYVYSAVFMMWHPDSGIHKRTIMNFINESRKKTEIKEAIKTYRPNGMINRCLRDTLRINSVTVIYVLMKLVNLCSGVISRRYRRASV